METLVKNKKFLFGDKMGRRSIEKTNEIRSKAGLPLIKRKPPKVYKKKSDAILPVSKKKRHQEILAGMLNIKGKRVVDKVLEKAMNDNDDDQMACLKIVMDRILPTDYVKNMKGGGNQIQIQISGIDTPKIDEVNTIDMETADGE